MSVFDYLKNLFPEKRNPNLPLVEEALQRSQSDQQDYFRWLNEGKAKDVLQKIQKAYQLKKLSLPSEIEVHFFKMNGSNGIAISYDSFYTPKEFQHLFDYLKDRVKNLAYLHHSSHRLVYEKKDYLETIQKHYLKPPIKLPENNDFRNAIDQHYGNVLIEYILIDEKPSFIRFLALTYSDQNYQNALPFEQLIQKIF